METLAPRDESELTEVVAAALANATPLEVAGAGTKRELGRPMAVEKRVSTRGMSGVTLYEPSELVLTAKAGTGLREIADLLSQQGQELAFEPIDYGVLYGGEPLSGTAGGLVAINACGPRRIRAGAARDHVLGFRGVSGRAEVFQSGGRVMKNVTGYDMSKLMTGSFGTLAVLSEVTLKVLPKAETEQTVVIAGLDDGAGGGILTEASGLPHEVSSLAHVPAEAAKALSGDVCGGAAVTALRLEGPEISVTQRTQDVIDHFRSRVLDFDTLGEGASTTFWSEIRDVVPLAGRTAQIWRISTAPAAGPELISALVSADIGLAAHYFDWAGGLIWLAMEPSADANAVVIRTAVEGAGGHATLVRADDAVRSETPVFHPQPRALAALTARVKTSFDPERILNRGRMREDL